ncbi:MAG: hypothetical protein LBI65_00965 [Candidatus Symbiothrix sp.]|jgi:hypothetical protein|nr:hypothetical protein [Candidatus Symbiothrix sp.]
MKTTFRIKLLLFCLLFFPSLQARVNIGIIEAPADGALLQLKNIAGVAPGDENANGGLLLPRVSLKNYTSLEPAVPDAEATPDEKRNHVGLIVYNLTETTYLKKGLAVWNGTRWNCITSNEVMETTGMDVKKNLYSSQRPQPDKTVVSGSIEINMELRNSTEQPHHAVPQFKISDSYKPGAGVSRKYAYLLTQYYRNNDKAIYSNDLFLQSFTSGSGYIRFDTNSTSGHMSPIERNEVWMYDDTDNSLFHIQLFEMGEDTKAATKIYVIMVEHF